MGLSTMVRHLYREYGHVAGAAMLLLATNFDTAQATHKEKKHVYAARVIEFKAGKGTEYTDPKKALGPPSNPNGFENAVTLGDGGHIVVGFERCIETGPGIDIVIGEFSISEDVYVHISRPENPLDFIKVGEKTFVGGPIGIDLDKYGIIGKIQFVKITDAKSGKSYDPYLGADIDYVQANHACPHQFFSRLPKELQSSNPYAQKAWEDFAQEHKVILLNK